MEAQLCRILCPKYKQLKKEKSIVAPIQTIREKIQNILLIPNRVPYQVQGFRNLCVRLRIHRMTLIKDKFWILSNPINYTTYISCINSLKFLYDWFDSLHVYERGLFLAQPRSGHTASPCSPLDHSLFVALETVVAVVERHNTCRAEHHIHLDKENTQK